VPFVGSYTAARWVTPSASDWLILVMIGLATTIAQIFMTRAYQLERASNVSNFNYLGSIYAIVLGILLFDESVTGMALAGIALIVFGVIMSARYRAS
jgi:S-adenosylmethionine uptake transporter